MKKQKRITLWAALGSLAAFVLWTILVCHVDVRQIGPNGSAVGFAALNGAFHRLTGVHWMLYVITDRLMLVPLGIVSAFAVLGLVQLVQRKSIFKVDRSLRVLGAFYIVVLAIYLLFEKAVVNYRPVVIEGVLEASYPSSTTMLALCVIPTAMMQLRARIRSASVRRAALALLAALAVFMTVGRLLSGVHWLSDIAGGVLLSAGLDALYAFVCKLPDRDSREQADPVL